MEDSPQRVELGWEGERRKDWSGLQEKKWCKSWGHQKGGELYSKFVVAGRVAEASKIQEMRLLHIEPRSKSAARRVSVGGP